MEASWKKLLYFGTVWIIVEVTHQTASTYYIHEYILVTDLKMSWIDAQGFCRTMYSDLATISDEEDIKRVNDMNWAQSFWIGLYDDVDSWKWSLVNEVFYLEEGRTYRQWQEGQPDNAGSAERCVSMMEDGFWRDNSCTLVKMALVCFQDGGGDKYVLVTEQKSWIDAQSYCRKHHTDLVSVRSQAENQEVQSRLQAIGAMKETWIGLRRDSWKWSDGSSSSFRFWAHAQPDNNNGSQACAHMNKGEWDDRTCTDKDNFLCQNITQVMPTPQTGPTNAELRRTTVNLRLHTDSNLKDPAIRNTFLLQVKAAFNLQGLTGVKLSLRTLMSEPKPTETGDTCLQKTK